MKRKFAPLTLILLAFAAQTFAQTKFQSLKFDEFDDSPELYYSMTETSLSDRINRFIAQIDKERSRKIYIIYYKARRTDYGSQYKISNWAERTRSEIIDKTKLRYDDVIVVDGGYREKNTLEYWIAPKSSEHPTPTPTFSVAETFSCPNIYISAEGFQFDKKNPISFSVSVYPKMEVSYEWKVSSGKIIEGGEGKDFIRVNLSDSTENRVTAFVEVKGLNFPCSKTALTTVELGQKAFQYDSAVRYNESDLAARLDGFMVQLGNNPTMTGYIVVYGDRTNRARSVERAITSVRRFFVFRRYDMSRVTIIRGGFREYGTVDSWLVLPGVAPPIPTPSVNSKFISTPKAVKPRKKL